VGKVTEIFKGGGKGEGEPFNRGEKYFPPRGGKERKVIERYKETKARREI